MARRRRARDEAHNKIGRRAQLCRPDAAARPPARPKVRPARLLGSSGHCGASAAAKWPAEQQAKASQPNSFAAGRASDKRAHLRAAPAQKADRRSASRGLRPNGRRRRQQLVSGGAPAGQRGAATRCDATTARRRNATVAAAPARTAPKKSQSHRSQLSRSSEGRLSRAEQSEQFTVFAAKEPREFYRAAATRVEVRAAACDELGRVARRRLARHRRPAVRAVADAPGASGRRRLLLLAGAEALASNLRLDWPSPPSAHTASSTCPSVRPAWRALHAPLGLAAEFSRRQPER